PLRTGRNTVMIDLDAVRHAPWNPTPYPWAALPTPLQAGRLDELVDRFPVDGFTHDTSSPNHERRQQTRTLAVRAGGRLLHQVRTGERGQDVVASIPPRPGSSVMIRATPSSWHAVAPVSGSERRSVSIHYFRPEADLSWFLPQS